MPWAYAGNGKRNTEQPRVTLSLNSDGGQEAGGFERVEVERAGQKLPAGSRRNLLRRCEKCAKSPLATSRACTF